ncbi:MAG: DUF4358 domain-containing protein [Oscillospiraceae bacterium]|nr:DUF4358 domain-containing protein [Oscillospiraceae bacterium]
MKLFKNALIVILAVVMLCACGGGKTAELPEPDVAQLAENMFAAVELEDELMSIDTAIMGNLYEYDSESIAAAAVYTSSTMSTPEEIAVFKAANADSVEYVEEMVKLRLQNLTFSYEDYQPLEMPKIDNAKIITKGLYTAFIVCADPAPAQEVFEKAFS